MTDIEKQENLINAGGNCSVEWIYRDYVSDIPTAVDGQVDESEIELDSSEAFGDIYGTPETIKVEISPNSTDNGMEYGVSVALRYPKDQYTISAQFQEMVQRGIILKVEDANGVRMIMGTIDNPMYMKFKTLKPESHDGYNGYEVTFDAKFSHHPYYLY